MAGKRSASRMMAQVASMAKKSKLDIANEEPLEQEESGEEYRARAAEFFQKESPEHYFSHELCKYSAAERYLEYLFFMRNLPHLLEPEKGDLVNLVKRELNIEEYRPSENDTPFFNRQFTFAESSTPILDALGCKIGKSLTMWLFPPTKKCLLCSKMLIKNNEPSQVVVHTLGGSVLATKYIYRCRDCKKQGLLNNNKSELNHDSGDVHYNPTSYGNPSHGYRFYSKDYEVPVIRSSSEVYLSVLCVKSYSSELQHGFLTSIGKAESYNETFLNTPVNLKFERFLHHNPHIGKRFEAKKAKNNDEEETEYNTEENNDDHEDVRDCKMYEMKRKRLTAAFLNYEMLLELSERDMENETFGPKKRNGEVISFEKSANEFKIKIDTLRKSEIYQHNTCSKGCRDRGCKWVIAGDGNWKLRYPICMWDAQQSIPKDLGEYLPNACPDSPVYGHAFCEHHCTIAKKLGKPTLLNDFIKHCGVDPDALTKDGKGKMSAVLAAMAKNAIQLEKESTFDNSDSQGTNYLLRNRNISKPENFKVDANKEEDCRKDTGEKVVQKRTLSRGVFCFVSGGGIIRSWSPLYKSEGPTQVALLMTSFLETYLGSVIPNPEDWAKFFLSYDNMCHIDELKLLHVKLNLTEPFCDMWQKINKVIDDLHIRNHTRPSCKTLYNPDQVKTLYPEANTMQCEQTFAWLARYKKILNSTSKVNFHFMLHRLVVGRNSYTERCYKEGRRPLLPSAKGRGRM